MRRVPAIAVLVVVLLAGCGGFGGDATTTGITESDTTTGASFTETTVDGTEQSTTDAADDSAAADPIAESAVPPGANATHVTAPDELLSAHTDALAETSYRVRYDVDAVSGNETLADSTDFHVSDPDRERHVWRLLRSDSDRIQFYNESAVYVNVTQGDDTRVYATPPADSFAAVHDPTRSPSSQRQQLSRLLRTGTYTANGTVERHGRTLARYDLTAPEDGSDATGYVLVRASGVVERAFVHQPTETDGERGYFEYTYRLQTLGDVTVDRPDWVSDADE